jgi:hypothetical protein
MQRNATTLSTADNNVDLLCRFHKAISTATPPGDPKHCVSGFRNNTTTRTMEHYKIYNIQQLWALSSPTALISILP